MDATVMTDRRAKPPANTDVSFGTDIRVARAFTTAHRTPKITYSRRGKALRDVASVKQHNEFLKTVIKRARSDYEDDDELEQFDYGGDDDDAGAQADVSSPSPGQELVQRRRERQRASNAEKLSTAMSGDTTQKKLHDPKRRRVLSEHVNNSTFDSTEISVATAIRPETVIPDSDPEYAEPVEDNPKPKKRGPPGRRVRIQSQPEEIPPERIPTVSSLDARLAEMSISSDELASGGYGATATATAAPRKNRNRSVSIDVVYGLTVKGSGPRAVSTPQSHRDAEKAAVAMSKELEEEIEHASSAPLSSSSQFSASSVDLSPLTQSREGARAHGLHQFFSSVVVGACEVSNRANEMTTAGPSKSIFKAGGPRVAMPPPKGLQRSVHRGTTTAEGLSRPKTVASTVTVEGTKLAKRGKMQVYRDSEETADVRAGGVAAVKAARGGKRTAKRRTHVRTGG
ncbi:uncharacterized protein V1518DRAFT_419709 [Limtongia smithiae]|uniref:uncharacterized protein n=1 Tax=Limtongia smithiae TaxID=1125753 RepID=UPI0034CF98C9